MKEGMGIIDRIVNWIEKIYRRGKKLFEETVEAKERKMIAIDEKEIRINGVRIYIWAAVDIEDEKVIKFGPRSAIERFFGNLEWRIRRFWNAYNGKYSIQSMQKWVEAFAGFRNFYKDLEVLS